VGSRRDKDFIALESSSLKTDNLRLFWSTTTLLPMTARSYRPFPCYPLLGIVLGYNWLASAGKPPVSRFLKIGHGDTEIEDPEELRLEQYCRV